jgi:uncharacterized protein YaeQ
VLRAWIEVGAPSADRLHKAAKAADRVAIFTHTDLAPLRRELATRAIHKAGAIEVWRIDQALLDALETRVDRHTSFELVRSDGMLYVAMSNTSLEGAVERSRLVD